MRELTSARHKENRRIRSECLPPRTMFDINYSPHQYKFLSSRHHFQNCIEGDTSVLCRKYVRTRSVQVFVHELSQPCQLGVQLWVRFDLPNLARKCF